MAMETPRLTSDQVDKYLEYIDIPRHFRQDQQPELNIAFLEALHVHHIATFPYENLSLHYTQAVNISLNVQDLYRKFLGNGRGGCHIVNIIVLPDGSRYSCDVGFGGDGPTRPLPLISGHISSNLGPQEVRLEHQIIPGYLTEPQQLWVYQYRNSTDRPWNSFYAFGENEWLPHDFDAINYWASTNPDSFQTYTMLIVRFLRNPENGQIYGKVMLVNGDIKQNLGGKTSLLLSCKTEEERIKALKDEFDITLTDEEREGIKGRPAGLPSLPN